MTHPSPVHSNRRLPGKMQRWQRLASFWLLGACCASGLAWFGGLDLLQVPVPRLRFWWVSHGATSLLALLLIGAALPQHLVITWKAGRNRRHGIFLVAGLVLLLTSALVLLYGLEEWHETVHWLHVVTGMAMAIVFPWHVWRGRRQTALGNMPKSSL